MTEQEQERHAPEEKAKQPSGGAPEFEQVAGGGNIPDPSGDTEITESDKQNPLVNDSSFEQSEKGGREND